MTRSRNLIKHLSLAGMAVIMLLLGVAQSAAAYPQPVAKAKDAYNFPIKPGTAAWAALPTHDDMLRATQLPARVLAPMSTEGLVETVLNYPLYNDMLAFNDLQYGFNTVASRFNGLTALLQRPDAGAVLLARYQAMDPTAIAPDATLLKQGQIDGQFAAIEMLLAQDSIRKSLSGDQQATLVNETLKKFEAKQQRADVYGHTGRERTALVLGRILRDQSASFAQADVALQEFLNTGTFAPEEVLVSIIATADPKSATPDDIRINDYATTIYTPRGTAVSATAMTTELTSAQITSYNNYVATNYPSATRETSASRKYNCHSYAWYNQSTSNSIWLNTPGDDKFWQDGSYVPSYNVGAGGRKVSYANDDHSAITVDAIKFRSKWGQLPRMYHSYNYSPYNSSALYYYQ